MNKLENNPESLKDKIDFALNWLEIRRLIHSIKISSFGNLSERFALTYVNLSENSHNILYLPPMRRITQRRLKVFDGSDNELAIVPSYEIHEALRKLSEEYLDETLSCIERDEEIGENASELKCSFGRIFTYGDNEEEIDKANEILEHLESPEFESRYLESLASESKERYKNSLKKLAYLVNIQRQYTPFIELKEPFPPEKHCIINYTVETTKRTGLLFYKKFLFYIKGEIRALGQNS